MHAPTRYFILPLILVGAGLVQADSPVSISVWPRIAQYGGYVRVSCKIPPSKENRWVDIGVEGFTNSRVQLDEDSSLLRTRQFEEPLCGEQIAYCDLLTRDGKQ